jgi:hypothetical protein
MASTTFIDQQTIIYAEWLNDVNSTTYNGTFIAATITPSNLVCNGSVSGTGFTSLISNVFSAPGPIGNATPSTGAFTTLTATTPVGAASGGTGRSTLTANNVLLGNGTSAVQQIAPGTAGNTLTSNGTTWASSSSGLGNSSQSWQNVGASRTQGTTYTNSTGSPILLSIQGGDKSAQPFTLTITVNGAGTPAYQLGGYTNGYGMFQIVIPVGATYSATWNASATFYSWFELR